MAVGVAAFPAGLILGYLYDAISPHAAFLYAIIVTLVALILLLAIRPKKGAD